MLLNGAAEIEEMATQFPQFSEIAVALRLTVSLVCPRPNTPSVMGTRMRHCPLMTQAVTSPFQSYCILFSTYFRSIYAAGKFRLTKEFTCVKLAAQGATYPSS
jgi:hypothetical protein